MLLPNKDIDLQKWAVIACDQYTSQPEYWKEVESFVGDVPSALKLTLPEIYLGEAKQRTVKFIKRWKRLKRFRLYIRTML